MQEVNYSYITIWLQSGYKCCVSSESKTGQPAKLSGERCSVLEINVLLLEHGVSYQLPAVKVGAVHVHGADSAVEVGRVVVNSGLGVPAGGVDRDLELSGRDLAAAAGLLNGAENMENCPTLSASDLPERELFRVNATARTSKRTKGRLEARPRPFRGCSG